MNQDVLAPAGTRTRDASEISSNDVMGLRATLSKR